jgi:ribosomal-protein-serine acetyltransferase
MMFQVTVAPGLELRHVGLGDADALFAATERNREYLREWLPWVDRTHSPDDTRAYIQARLDQTAANLGPTAAIVVDHEVVGTVGCHPIDWLNRNCELGYWLEERHQGKGVVTRAVAALCDYLFEEVGLHRLVIRCGTGNAKSCAIPKRLGFVREGVLRESQWVNDRFIDGVVWSMLARDWKAHSKRT